MKQFLIASLLVLCSVMSSAQSGSSNIEENFDVFLLQKTEWLPFSSGQFLVLPTMGLFMTNNIEFVSLDSIQCPNMRSFRLKVPYTCEKLFFYDGKMMIKNGKYILSLEEDNINVISKLDTADFEIFPITNTLFSIIYQNQDGKYVWAVLNSEENKMTPQIASNEPIVKVEQYGNHFFIASGNNLLLCDEVGIYDIGQFEEPIKDFVASEMGIFICTESTLYIMTTDYQMVPLLHSNYHSLYKDVGCLYIVTAKGDIYALMRKDKQF